MNKQVDEFFQQKQFQMTRQKQELASKTKQQVEDFRAEAAIKLETEKKEAQKWNAQAAVAEKADQQAAKKRT